jgi:PAS domain S-box-containing protein
MVDVCLKETKIGRLMRQIALFVIKSVLIAMAYTAIGRLSYTLAVPPAFAVPIWPAAGLSLAVIILGGYRYLPAIFIGALATNLILSIETAGDESFISAIRSLPTASWISFGGMVQAAFGAFLVRKFMPASSIPPSNHHDVFTFLLLGGWFGSIVSATVGTLTLYMYGILPAEGMISNYLSWWLGDAVGVSLLAPFIFLLLDKRSSFLRKFIVIIPSCIFVTLVIVAFFTAKEIEKNKRQTEVDRIANDLASELEEDLQSYLHLLIANERFILSSEYVSDNEFDLFTREFFKRFEGLSGMGWLPKITHEQRESHEASIRQQGYPNFSIKRRFDYGVLDVSEPKDVYFPVTYVRPYEKNKSAHGFDVNGLDPIVGDMRERSLKRARDSALPIVTGRFPIVQAESQYGFIVYHPVFSVDMESSSISERRKSLIGYCSGIFTFPDLMENLRKEALQNGFDVLLKDASADNPALKILYDSRTKDFKENETLDEGASKAVVKINFAGRVWEIYFLKKEEGSSSHLWLLLIIGLLICCIFSLFLIWLSTYVESVQKEILAADKPEKTTLATLSAGVVAGITLLTGVSISHEFRQQEEGVIHALIMEEMDLVKQGVMDNLEASVLALRRMAKRWEFRKDIPKDEWLNDANNYVLDFPALTTVEFVNSNDIIEWIQPLEGNEKAVGLNIVFDEKRKAMLEGAKMKGHITMTAPFYLVQGYQAFLIYIPMYIGNNFDGFIAGVFDTDKLIRNVVHNELLDNFYIVIRDGSEIVFQNSEKDSGTISFASELSLNLLGKKWSVILSPKEHYIEYNTSYFVLFMQVANVLFSMLIGFSVYTSLISHQRNKLVKRKGDELAESEAKMQSIVDNTVDGLITIDHEGAIQSYNKACESIFGYSQSEIIGKNIKSLMPEYDDLMHGGHIESYQKNKDRKGIMGFSQEVNAVRQNGEIFPAEISVSEVMMPDGIIYSGIVRDITSRKKMIETLTDSNEELERFAYVCSHDLQEPLRMVRSFTEKLENHFSEAIKGDEKGQRYMNYVMDGAERAQELIRDILSYSSLDRDTKRYENVDLNKLVGLIKETMQVSLKGGGEIIHDELPDVMGNRTQIYQLLQNLISNGLKYQRPDMSPCVNISSIDLGDCWQITVQDNGIGMEERHLGKIFDVFQRLHRKDEFSGTGIGLAICKKIVERHGGKIWVESKKGEGSTFFFTLLKSTGGENKDA